MHRPLLIAGGVLSSMLAVFHVWLGYQIHLISNITADLRALTEMLNAGGTL